MCFTNIHIKNVPPHGLCCKGVVTFTEVQSFLEESLRSGVFLDNKTVPSSEILFVFKLVTQIWAIDQKKAAWIESDSVLHASLHFWQWTIDPFAREISLMWPRLEETHGLHPHLVSLYGKSFLVYTFVRIYCTTFMEIFIRL